MTPVARLAARPVRLHDGTEVDSDSEGWRHECEARHILRLPSLAERRAWLDAIAKRRGDAEMRRLQATMRALWEAERRADLARARVPVREV